MGVGWGDRTSPGEPIRKQGSPKSEVMEWHLSTAGRAEERETQVQLAAAVRLRGHPQETRRKDGRMLSLRLPILSLRNIPYHPENAIELPILVLCIITKRRP